MLGQGGTQPAFEAADQAPSQLLRALADQGDRLRGRAPVLAGVLDARVDLVVQAGDAHHVVLVEVGRVDRAELDPLEQRRGLVLGELQDAVVEVQPGELAVDVQRGIVQGARGGIVRGSSSSNIACGSRYTVRAQEPVASGARRREWRGLIR